MVTKTVGQNRAADICNNFALSDAARAHPPGARAPAEYLKVLRQAELHRDALFFMAHWLDKPATIWWGCLCVWELVRPEPSPADTAAIQAALTWLREPTEAHRNDAGAAGEKAGTTPAGLVAKAAFFSGGSMTRPELPVVPPPPELPHTMVAGAVLTAVAAADAENYRQRFDHAMQWGLDVANGTNLWN
jgi:hypothetical protein